MQIKVKLNYLRITPRKVRQIADLVRGKNAEQAQNFLEFTARKPANPVLKLLNSAIATAKHEFQLNPANLYISKITVDEGPKLKRFRPVSRGSAHPLWKRTSHIVLTLDEIKPSAKKKTKKKKEEPVEPVEIVEEVKADISKKRPSFEKQDFGKQKGQNTFNRIFRRKSI